MEFYRIKKIMLNVISDVSFKSLSSPSALRSEMTNKFDK